MTVHTIVLMLCIDQLTYIYDISAFYIISVYIYIYIYINDL